MAVGGGGGLHDEEGVLVTGADRCVKPEGTRLAYPQDDLVAYPGGELSGQGLVDEGRPT